MDNYIRFYRKNRGLLFGFLASVSVLGLLVSAEDRAIVLNYFVLNGIIFYQLATILFVALDFLYLNDCLYDYVVFRNEVAIRKKMSILEKGTIFIRPLIMLVVKSLLVSIIFGLIPPLFMLINYVLFTFSYILILPLFEKRNKEELFVTVIISMAVFIRILAVFL